jgi:PAS domain S-box-containing protein
MKSLLPAPSIFSGFAMPEVAPATDWSEMGRTEHFVQFYDSDSFLMNSVSGFVAAGLSLSESAIVIATPGHRQELDRLLRLQGFDPDKERAANRLLTLDAAETLAKFMDAGKPDPRLFKQVIGGAFIRVGGHGLSIRAFGEMVALLFQEGNSDGAIRLEELWNELAKEHAFALFCAYPMGGFAGEAHGHPFSHICKAHSRVIPSESYTGTSNDDRLRTISLLQQKAATLEAEIARRKRTEAQLSRQKSELADFLETASEGIHQIAPDGKILWANKAELELLGCSAAEYIGHDIREFHADPKVIADILARLAHGENLREYESRLRCKDGSLRDVSINSSVCWEGEEFRYTRCFTRDITERKRAAQILEEKVAERTAQLRETLSELEAFSYSVSHDMRSPLRAMQGYARAILQDHGQTLAPDAVHGLERIQRAANRLDLLVRDVLAYSKIAKGYTALTPVELSPLLGDLLTNCPDLHSRISCISIEEPLPAVLGHEAYLAQCFTNLIENALKFVRPELTPCIRVSSQKLEGKVRISIKDNGIGIAPEHHHRIFQIFGRIHPDKLFPGTGIGLAVVKKAVERMGGETGFDSTPGLGSTFWFSLRTPDASS